MSCSFWDENIEGSSADKITIPPSTPVYATLIRESDATLRPTCFIKVKDLTPEAAAAAATSRATFSLVENSKYIPASAAIFEKTSPISDEGVPGYVDANPTPASRAPLTVASLPSMNSCSFSSAVKTSFIFIIIT